MDKTEVSKKHINLKVHPVKEEVNPGRKRSNSERKMPNLGDGRTRFLSYGSSDGDIEEFMRRPSMSQSEESDFETDLDENMARNRIGSLCEAMQKEKLYTASQLKKTLQEERRRFYKIIEDLRQEIDHCETMLIFEKTRNEKLKDVVINQSVRSRRESLKEYYPHDQDGFFDKNLFDAIDRRNSDVINNWIQLEEGQSTN